jgi:hypothetical protein
MKHAAFAVSQKKTQSPDEPLFKRFKDEFDSLEKTFTTWKWPANKSCFLLKQGQTVLNWAKECLKSKTFPREDYLELCQLIVLFLGGDIGKTDLRRPGAIHHARFMGKSLYYLKIFRLSKSFKMNAEETERVKRIALFTALFYGNIFLNFSILNYC